MQNIVYIKKVDNYDDILKEKYNRIPGFFKKLIFIYKNMFNQDSVKVKLNFYDENSSFISSEALKTDKTGWEKISLGLTVPFGAKTADILIESGSGTAVTYVDNILVVNKTVKGEDEIKLEKINENAVLLFVGSPNALEKGKKTFIDSENAKVVPVIIDSRTLVPVRFIAEKFGVQVNWEEKTGTVILNTDEKEVKITLNQKEIFINGESLLSDTPALVIEGRTMLPLRIFCERVLGKKVFWDESGLIVITDEELLSDSDKEIIDKLIDKINE